MPSSTSNGHYDRKGRRSETFSKRPAVWFTRRRAAGWGSGCWSNSWQKQREHSGLTRTAMVGSEDMRLDEKDKNKLWHLEGAPTTTQNDWLCCFFAAVLLLQLSAILWCLNISMKEHWNLSPKFLYLACMWRQSVCVRDKKQGANIVSQTQHFRWGQQFYSRQVHLNQLKIIWFRTWTPYCRFLNVFISVGFDYYGH